MNRAREELQALRVYAALTTVLSAAALLGAAHAYDRSTHIEDLTVHRLKVVDDDGTVRLVIANRQHFPAPLMRGHELPAKYRTVGDTPSFMFYNRDGTEQGAFRWDGHRKTSGQGSQYASLTLDQLEQNDNLLLWYSESAGHREVGLAGVAHEETPTDILLQHLEAP